MGYRTLRECVEELEATEQLVRIEQPVDPHLEAAEIQRRVFRAGGPAIYYASVKGCRFPMVSNLFGTMSADPLHLSRFARGARASRPAGRQSCRRAAPPWPPPGPAHAVGGLVRPGRSRSAPGPSWPRKLRSTNCRSSSRGPRTAAPYITLPQVYTEAPDAPGLTRSNLGMYRVQISGGQYEPGQQAGIHYQIHRGIGVHHCRRDPSQGEAAGEHVRRRAAGDDRRRRDAAARGDERAGLRRHASGDRRVPMICRPGELPIHAEADFCI